MIVDALKNPIFGYMVSFMLGLAIVIIIAPICRGKECMVVKAPPIHEVRDSIYHIASKCYKFETVQMDCPAQGVVEAFENVRKSIV
jgi:hypothetical protein|uniref:Uncharacterized protein n=1 Tax=viral metagenome TaxID=1070528 RepID=A0A6C0DIB8_9ZZZZ